MHPFRLAPILRAACLAAGLAVCLAGAVEAVEIRPDPSLHGPEARTLSVGRGSSANVWRVFDVNKAHYKTEGRIIWFVSPLKNPIPNGRRGEMRWYRTQVQGLLRAMGEPAPKQISVSTAFARSSVVGDITPFRANLYVQFPDGREIVDVIYVEAITGGAGRLIVLQLPTKTPPPIQAASEFAKGWAGKLKDLTPDDWK